MELQLVLKKKMTNQKDKSYVAKLLLGFFISNPPLYADLGDLVTKQRAKQQKESKMTNRNSCYEYLSINNNKEWESSFKELDTFIEKATRKKCRKYVIYKVIKNVDIVEKGKLNIGVTISEISDITLESHVVIQNSSIEADSITLQVNHLEEEYDSDIVHKVDIINSEVKDDRDFSEDEDISDEDDFK